MWYIFGGKGGCFYTSTNLCTYTDDFYSLRPKAIMLFISHAMERNMKSNVFWSKIAVSENFLHDPIKSHDNL